MPLRAEITSLVILIFEIFACVLAEFVLRGFNLLG